MGSPPAAPKIYHITHVENLERMLPSGLIYSDARMIAEGHATTNIGMSKIKRRRLEEIEVDCHPGTKVGEYVPFYFCPRSVMLYLIYKGNHPELLYRTGQGPILHFEADFAKVTAWADREGRKWAFSRNNAGTYYAKFYADARRLSKIDWNAVEKTDFRDPEIKEAKQAEFLMFDSFPLTLIDRVVAQNDDIAGKATAALKRAKLKLPVTVDTQWYYPA